MINLILQSYSRQQTPPPPLYPRLAIYMQNLYHYRSLTNANQTNILQTHICYVKFSLPSFNVSCTTLGKEPCSSLYLYIIYTLATFLVHCTLF